MSDLNSILVVDDEDYFRKRLAKAFSKRGFIVYQAANHDEAMVMIKKHRPSKAVVDLKMPGKSGFEVIQDGLEVNDKMKIVLLTGYGNVSTATEAMRLGAVGYLPKPADVSDILNAFVQVKD